MGIKPWQVDMKFGLLSAFYIIVKTHGSFAALIVGGGGGANAVK